MGVAFINMRLINVNLSLIWSLNLIRTWSCLQARAARRTLVAAPAPSTGALSLRAASAFSVRFGWFCCARDGWLGSSRPVWQRNSQVAQPYFKKLRAFVWRHTQKC